MAFGKHITTTAELARAWGQLMVDSGWEPALGRILEIRMETRLATGVEYVGANLDGIGAAYFAHFELLDGAEIREVQDEL